MSSWFAWEGGATCDRVLPLEASLNKSPAPPLPRPLAAPEGGVGVGAEQQTHVHLPVRLRDVEDNLKGGERDRLRTRAQVGQSSFKGSPSWEGARG